jgi:hypothetical protein
MANIVIDVLTKPEVQERSLSGFWESMSPSGISIDRSSGRVVGVARAAGPVRI